MNKNKDQFVDTNKKVKPEQSEFDKEFKKVIKNNINYAKPNIEHMIDIPDASDDFKEYIDKHFIPKQKLRELLEDEKNEVWVDDGKGRWVEDQDANIRNNLRKELRKELGL